MNLEENELVDNWLSDVAESTGKKYIRFFGYFLDFYGLTPKSFLEEAKENSGKTKAKINKWYKHLKKEGKSPTYAATVESAIRSFLNFYDLKLKLKPRKKPTIYERIVLDKVQVRKLVETAQYLRDKAMIVLAFQTGMGISSLLKRNYGDIREAIENDKEYHIINYIRSKKETKGKAVIGRESINYLSQYINWRKEQIRIFNNNLEDINAKRKAKKQKPLKTINLTDDSPLFTGVRDFELQKRFTNRSAQLMLRETGVKAGLITFAELEQYKKFNPYGFHSIRKTFSSIAEIEGKLSDSQIKLSMAQKLDYNGAYKQFTDEQLIRNYKIAEPFLTTSVDTRKYEQKQKHQEEDIEKLQKALIKERETHKQEISELKAQFDELKKLVLKGHTNE
jgi:site-specific recombinase XerD